MVGDPYKVLGVSNSASDDEIKEKYKELVKKYHPDRYQNNPLSDLAEEKLREINEAYDEINRQRKSGKYNGSDGDGRNSSGYSSYSNKYMDVRRALDRNDLVSAKQMLEKIYERNGEYYFLYGVLSLKMGWYDNAVTNLQQAVTMEPNNREYRDVLNQVLNMSSVYRNSMGGMTGGSSDPCCRALQCYCLMDLCCDCI